MKKEVLVILPAYNEQEAIQPFLTELLQSQVPSFADILVVNDASQDDTAKITAGLLVDTVSHPFNLGYGAALQTGYKYAVRHGYRYVIQIDSDGQHDICNIPRIYERMQSTRGQADAPDLIIGSRFLKGSQSFPISLVKRIAVAFFRQFIRLTARQHVTDPTSGLQGLTQPVFSYYSEFGNFDTNYPDANMIVQMALLGFHIEEIPAVMHARKTGKSMHFGIIEPFFYMLVMAFSTCNAYLRSKLGLYPVPKIRQGRNNSE